MNYRKNRWRAATVFLPLPELLQEMPAMESSTHIKRLRALMQSGATSDEAWTYGSDRGALHGRDV